MNPMRNERRRRHARVAFDRPVRVTSGATTLTVGVADISEGGLCLESSCEHPLSSPLTVRIPLRGRLGAEEQCAIEGHVVRRRGSRVGVAFGRLLPRHMLQLRHHVWQRSL